MAEYFNVAIIGSGNVAWHLALALENAGHTVQEVYSRNPKHAGALVNKLYEATVREDLDFSGSEAEIFMIAVSDQVIEAVAAELILPAEAIVAHTSGSMPMEMLQEASGRIGVFYPLQTFSKASSTIDFRTVPLLIEGSDKKTERTLQSLAHTLSKTVRRMTSADREVLHVAAVFASNFTNHLLGVAQGILQKKKMDFALLQPLIVETINKSLDIGPENAQTGPAVREDLQTLDRHMAFLQYDRSLQEIYQTISQHIIDSNYRE